MWTVVFVDDPSNRQGHSGRPEERFTPKSLRSVPALWRGGFARSLHRSALRRLQRWLVSWCTRTIKIALLGSKLRMDPRQDDDRAKRDERRRQIRLTLNHPSRPALRLVYMFLVDIFRIDQCHCGC